MSIPSLSRRHVVAGLATVGLIGGGVGSAVVANAATADTSAPTSSSTSASATAKPTPPTPKPHIDGTVVSVSGDTITVKDQDGFTRVIAVSSSTKYTFAGKTSTLSAVLKGRFVHGDGKVDSNGTSLDATTVAIMTSAPKPGAGPDGGLAGHGPAGRGPGGRGPAGPAGVPKAGGKAPSGPPPAPRSSATSSAHGS